MGWFWVDRWYTTHFSMKEKWRNGNGRQSLIASLPEYLTTSLLLLSVHSHDPAFLRSSTILVIVQSIQYHFCCCCTRSLLLHGFALVVVSGGYCLLYFSYCSWGSQGKNTEVVCHSLLKWTTFCQNFPPWHIHLGWPYTAWFIVSLVRQSCGPCDQIG